MIRITPLNGLKVINPLTMKPLLKDGIVVVKMSTHWNNRLKDGDIKVTKITTPKKKEKGK